MANPQTWAQWWPGVDSVCTLKPGDACGLGSVQRLAWSTGLPGGSVVDVQTVEALRLERLRCRTQASWPSRLNAPLQGECIWLLRPEGLFTDVTQVWRLDGSGPQQPGWAASLAPVLRWAHRKVMRAGGIGLARHLAARR